MTTIPPPDAAGDTDPAGTPDPDPDTDRRETARHLAEQRLAQRATRILTSHVRDADGWCAGCLADFGTFRLHPCYLATWAMEVTAVPEAPS